MNSMFSVYNDMKAKSSVDDARKGLKTLGIHPISLKYTYLELDLSKKKLSGTDICGSFPHVIYLNISNNDITSLEYLSALSCIVQLDASNNKLTECLDFIPRHCTEKTPTSSGHTEIGSMLTMVDLSDNDIAHIGSQLKNHPFIECLFLGGNRISKISGMKELKFLRVLDLSRNMISSIHGLTNLNIRELNLEANKLTTLDGLASLNHLTSLNVSKNFIESLSPLKACSQLSYLDVSENRILEIKQVTALKELEWMNILIMEGNPCYRKDFYRLRVLFRLPNLRRLDKVNVSFEEKIRAFNLYKTADGDLQLREKVFSKYLPKEEFVDYCSQQLPFDDEGTQGDGDEAAGQWGSSAENSTTGAGDAAALPEEEQNQPPSATTFHQHTPPPIEVDPVADDNSSQASTNKENIGDLPSEATLRRKVFAHSLSCSNYSAIMFFPSSKGRLVSGEWIGNPSTERGVESRGHMVGSRIHLQSHRRPWRSD